MCRYNRKKARNLQFTRKQGFQVVQTNRTLSLDLALIPFGKKGKKGLFAREFALA